MAKRILLAGAQGQLGQELQTTLTPLGEVIGVGRESMDLSQPASIRQIISQIQPHFIVNAAAYTAVDKAESEVELAYAINAIAPEILAQEAQKLGATLLQISTDYVFDGQKNTPYLEEDFTNPLSIYGKSKLAGEEGIKQACQSYIILRTAWVYGTYGKSNFVKTMLRLGKEREEIRVVSDQVGSPTWARDIADAITELLVNPTTGVYHFTNSGVASWYDFAIAIFEEAKQLGFPLKVRQVIPITTAEYPTPAKRPAYSVLSGKKISTVLGTYPAYWRDSLRQMLKQFYAQ
ncbi:MAG: dTDP-4-dehydrorhamnose reductase [Hydrococcus sp. RU_2_2]|nr:dTDP-4-dehydrorhamnose reductase [Hydrococcus sp. RU_2_2]NJP19113.1 dTDP-4-dehydrorhamnose reductase [Hydrococcus sp. CRU_1_1]